MNEYIFQGSRSCCPFHWGTVSLHQVLGRETSGHDIFESLGQILYRGSCSFSNFVSHLLAQLLYFPFSTSERRTLFSLQQLAHNSSINVSSHSQMEPSFSSRAPASLPFLSQSQSPCPESHGDLTLPSLPGIMVFPLLTQGSKVFFVSHQGSSIKQD